uniref:Uncharacterized protein n=1 Tax=Fagus sylvatica TaxID=28930 RepID=A0A2N9HLY0_FAGSY
MVVKFNMLFVPVVISVLFLLGLLALEASCMVLPQEKPNMMKKKQLFRLVLQVQAQVPKPNPRTTGDISRLLCRQLLKGRVPLSAPNPGTNNPTSTRSHNVAPLLGSRQKSPLVSLAQHTTPLKRWQSLDQRDRGGIAVVASRFVTLDVLRGGRLGFADLSLSLARCGLRGRLGFAMDFVVVCH